MVLDKLMERSGLLEGVNYRKQGSYVGESGLPVRSAGDEFLILLPDVERNIAGEIAKKIKQGVEKLRFVNSGLRMWTTDR